MYQNCVISFYCRDIMVDPGGLEIVDFDVTMGMGWSNCCYAIVDYECNRACFYFSN